MTKDKISFSLLCSIIATSMLSFTGVLVETALNVAFPTLIREFKVTTDQVQWMTTIVLLIVAIIVPLSSYLKKRFAGKVVFCLGMLFFIAGTLVEIFSPKFALLLLGRALQGVGVGIGLPLMFNTILDQVPKSKIGTMMGLGTMFIATAPALGPTFGGIVTQYLGWRYIFIIVLPFLLLALIAGLLTLKQVTPLRRDTFNFEEYIFLALMIVGFIFGFTNLASRQFLSFYVGGSWLLSLIFAILWFKTAKQSKNPLLNPKLFQNKSFLAQLTAYSLIQFIALAVSFALPNYIQLVNHESTSLTGFLILPGALTNAIIALFAGRILDLKGPRFPILTGLIIATFFLLLTGILGMHLTNFQVALLYALYLIGNALCFGPLMTSGLTELDPHDQAQGNAAYNSIQQSAGAVGTALASVIIALFQQRSQFSCAYNTAAGFSTLYYVLAGIALFCFLLAVKNVRKR